MVWNPQLPESWANRFGFVSVPLFGQHRAPNASSQHFVLLDGHRSSLTFSRGPVGELLNADRALGWAWSSNVPRAFVVDDNTGAVHAARWDDPQDIRELVDPTPESAQALLLDLESPSHFAVNTSVERAIGVFRSVRREVGEHGGNDLEATRAFIVLILIADLIRHSRLPLGKARTLTEVLKFLPTGSKKLIIHAPFSSGVSELPIVDLATQLLEMEQYTLDPYLLIRHAGGTLFQEAHIELANPPKVDTKLFVSLHPGLPRPAGIFRRDAHYTPTSLARFLTEQALHEFVRLNPKAHSISILDPACGSGVFLVEALRELEGGKLSATLRGVDSSPISRLMTDFTLASAQVDFSATGGSVKLLITQGDSLDNSWGQPDVVLMNPPFLPWRRLNSSMRKQVKKSLGHLYIGQADTALAFLAKAIVTLKPGAVLATVVPAAILRSRAASKLRRLLSRDDWRIAFIGRIRDYGVFTNAAVEPAFIVISHAPKGDAATRTLLSEADATDRAIRAARVSNESTGPGWEIGYMSSLDPADWSPRPHRAAKLLDKLWTTQTVRRLKDLFQIRLGIRTGDNSVFRVSPELIDNMGEAERRWFQPVADTIRLGKIQREDYVFYPYRAGELAIKSELDLKRASPLFYERRLKPNMDKLKARASLRDRKWWELVEPRTSWLKFGVPRIVSMTFGQRGAFGFDKKGEFAVLQGQAWIWRRPTAISDDMAFAYLAILNSPIFEAVVDYFCPRTQGGQYELAQRFVQQMPLPDITKLPSRLVKSLAGYGRSMQRGLRVSLRSLNDGTAAAYQVTIEQFVEGFPIAGPSRAAVEFEHQASKWKRETAMMSSSAQRMRHPAIQRIREMGDAAVPLIIRDLKERPSWWFSLLRELTGVDPVPADKKGFLDESASAWIAWARRSGYEL